MISCLMHCVWTPANLAAPQVREEGIEAQHHHQLQARSAGKQDAYAAKQAAIHAARVRTIRQLAHAQKIAAAVAAPGGGSLVLAPGGSRLKPDIIDRYKDWASPGEQSSGLRLHVCDAFATSCELLSVP